MHGRCRCFRGYKGADCGQVDGHTAVGQHEEEHGVEERVAAEVATGDAW